jgi:hypothetical protein
MSDAVDYSYAPRLARTFPASSRAAAYLASMLVCAPFLYHLAHRSNAFLGLLEDDYFYYAIIADKLVTLGRTTYDGATLTNGFHPLWFAILTGLRWAFGRFGTAFYVALCLTFLAALALTFELGRRFAARLGASPVLAGIIAAVYSYGTARLFTGGMECVVAVPCFLWFLIEIAEGGPITPRRAARVGFIASLAILGRLDIALASGLMVVGVIVLVRPRATDLGRLLLAFGAGGILVPIYALANYAYYGTVLPVSALAKRLQTAPGFNASYARGIALGTTFGPTVAIVLPLGLIALCLLVRRDRRQPQALFAGGLALIFAFLFFGINALTGWVVFGWYAYPLVPALTAALVFIIRQWGNGIRATKTWAIAVALVVGSAPLLAARYYFEHGPRWSVQDNSMLAMSHDLARRVRGRAGLFAMGAVGGIATYVLDRPVLQVEGIVSDLQMVAHVRHEDPLPDVLREYHADYLVVSLHVVRSSVRNGCYLITQPNAEWAGLRSAKMSGEICTEPIEHFYTPAGSNPWSVFGELETLVWDLRNARWREATDDRIPSSHRTATKQTGTWNK